MLENPSPRAEAACFIDFLLILNLLLAAEVTLNESRSLAFLTSKLSLTSISPLGLVLFCPGLQSNGCHL